MRAKTVAGSSVGRLRNSNAKRHSAGTVLYVGATRGTVGLPLAPSRSTELFAKLQFDLNEMARWW